MSVILQPHVQERLRSDEMIWLITVRPDGRPHCAPVWFLWENATVLIFSEPNTQKIRNLRQNHAVSLAFDDTRKGQDVAILEGTAELLGRGKGDESLQPYDEKYRERLQRMGLIAQHFTMRYSQPIRITPTHLIIGK